MEEYYGVTAKYESTDCNKNNKHKVGNKLTDECVQLEGHR